MHERLSQLTEEFNQGVRELQTLDQRRSRLRDDLLRMSGAIQALREIEAGAEAATDSTRTTTDPGIETAPAPGVGPKGSLVGAVDDAA